MQQRNLIKSQTIKNRIFISAKESAFIGVFVAILIAVQFALSFVPGVELVTVLLTAYSFAMGVKRGVISAVAFSFLRQIIFGFVPNVLVLYVVYYSLLAIVFGSLSKKIKNSLKWLAVISIIACVCVAIFSLLDCAITPLFYGYGSKSTRLYFIASLPFMITQIICAAVTVTLLFLPLNNVFQRLLKILNQSRI